MMPAFYRVALQHADQPEAGGLARGRVVGLATATAYESHDAATRALHDWLTGGDGDRATRWTGTVVAIDTSEANGANGAENGSPA